VAGEEAGQLLSSCERSAVHLEMRDGYNCADPMFADWRQGQRHDATDWEAWWRPWTGIVVAARSRGVIIRRARIVSEPVSEYIRWEHEITSANVEAGEDVRWLPRRRASDLLLPGNDFWVFDDRVVLWTHFTGEGEISPEGWEVTEDPAQAKVCAAAFEPVWDRAVPHGDYRPA
jgi:Family of unknown function (DUF6879)